MDLAGNMKKHTDLALTGEEWSRRHSEYRNYDLYRNACFPHRFDSQYQGSCIFILVHLLLHIIFLCVDNMCIRVTNYIIHLGTCFVYSKILSTCYKLCAGCTFLFNIPVQVINTIYTGHVTPNFLFLVSVFSE